MRAEPFVATESGGILVVGPQQRSTIGNTIFRAAHHGDPGQAPVVCERFRAQQAAVHPVFLVACVETVADCLILKEPICGEPLGPLRINYFAVEATWDVKLDGIS